MVRGGRLALQLPQGQGWRQACELLALSYDGVMKTQIQTMTGVTPWQERRTES
jgi:hypothetical protein